MRRVFPNASVDQIFFSFIYMYAAPYSFDKDVLMKLLEEEKEKIRHKLEGFAVLLREAGVRFSLFNLLVKRLFYSFCDHSPSIVVAVVRLSLQNL